MNTLIFAYNADSGPLNGLIDAAHKIISPQTYQCNLCAITYSHFGMRKEWKQFVKTLDIKVEFLHRNELIKQYAIKETKLPAIFSKDNDTLALKISADEINTCHTLQDLIFLIKARMANNG